MHHIEITGREFDLFYIPMRELLWKKVRAVGEKEGQSVYPPEQGRRLG